MSDTSEPVLPGDDEARGKRLVLDSEDVDLLQVTPPQDDDGVAAPDLP